MNGRTALLCAVLLGLAVVSCLLVGAPEKTPAVAAMSDMEFYGGLLLIAGGIAAVAFICWWLMFGSIGLG